MAGTKQSGRRRKPTALRKGHRAYTNTEPVVPEGPIQAPPLSALGVVVWNRLLPKLTDMKVMTPADTEALGVLCELIALFHQKPNARTAQTIRGYLVEFGLSPSARASLNVIPDADDEDESPYKEMGFM